MNLLVIGNGFDLAHGYPTSYGDFLDVINHLIQLVAGAKGKKQHVVF